MRMKKWLCCLLMLLLCGCQQDTSNANDTLTIYSPYPKHLIQPILKDFEHQENVKVTVIEDSTQVLLSKIHQTPKHARGDIFVGGVLSETIEHPEDFVPYKAPDLSKFRITLSDQPIVTPFILMPTVIVVNTDLQGDIHINGYTDLMQPALKQKVAYSNPKTTTTGYQHMRGLYHIHGNSDAIHQFRQQAVELPKSSDVIAQVAQGRYYAGLSYEQDARTWLQKGYPLKVIYPDEGTVLNIDGIALVNSQHPKRTALIHYLTSYTVQQRLAQQDGVKPIRRDVSEIKEPGIAQLRDIPVIPETALPHETHQKFLERVE
ncbi:extracellular solute-binding protein [Staphylococcus delphini]|uniref:extracellular solute-binding protein n=1 Tax=Staphylococcus delphini TaxID=53344 RepID=UPI003DA72F7A